MGRRKTGEQQTLLGLGTTELRLIWGDTLQVLPTMDADSVDAIVTDPPYELSNSGKASASRVALELMFPKNAKVNTDGSSEDHLPFLVSKIIGLRRGGFIPQPAATVPVRSVTLHDDAAGGDVNVEHCVERSIWESNGEGWNDGEAEANEHLGDFALELTDSMAMLNALNSLGCGFFAGGIGIGFGIDPTSLPSFCGGGLSINDSDEIVRFRHRALTDTISALSGTASIPVVRFDLGRVTGEKLAADGALVFCASLLFGGAKLVRTSPRAGGLPSMLESRRICIVDAFTNRALSFGILFHPQNIAQNGFMGKEWDGSKVAYDVSLWANCLRVLKPGGHLIAFGGDRTHHRLMVAVEDAGFEIRTCIYWCFGSGFPKSLDVGKALDRMAGAEREVVGDNPNHRSVSGVDYEGVYAGGNTGSALLTAPATEAARQWDGWGTALKPAVEIAVLARKPLGEGTVARNVIRHGVGALNIDACRVETSSQDAHAMERCNTSGSGQLRGRDPVNTDRGQAGPDAAERPLDTTQGRWPAHLLLDGSPEVLACFPETGISSGGRIGKKDPSSVNNIGSGKYRAGDPGFGDAGSAARYFPTFPPTETDRACAQEDRRLFYCAKTSKSERGEGNTHPTVKPLEMMRWMVRLVTPPGGTVLDPFMGSGSTGRACAAEGFQFVGIERERAYAEIAQRRLLVSQLEVGLGGRMEDETETRDAETEEK
jgi:site-specific DNA-methyltransferase (adenine-specific)